jgi:hypothetical protein
MTQKHPGQGQVKRARGTVERAGGAVVRRVVAYIDPATFDRLKAHCGDERTQSEALGEALRRYLGEP